MSWLKRLKGLFGGSKNDASKQESEDDTISTKIEVVDKNEVPNTQTSDKKIAEEKKDSSVANISITPKTDKIEEESKDSTESKDTETVEKVSTESNADKNVKGSEIAVEENKKVSEDKKGDKMTLLEDNDVIRRESVDKEFTQLFVDAGIETLEHCFQCGTCSGGCPSGRRTPYRVRQIVRKCLMGLKEEVISDPALWMCTTCYTCQERCPREVKIVEIIKKARNVAAENGYMSANHKGTGANVIKTGHGVPINDATKELRKRVGLSELPPTTHSDAKALADIQAICKATGFDKLIDYEG
ncbi:CoB--CoM heterodisulfide reductase subunit C [Methanobrevibacter curvatus]|uniref:Succinate dehydrogenase/fumarate reductase iron-sulfur subunit n=1 Tax=Methanobrevibacter curvatus TaxID=49547 RepID=A0A165ZRJ7_9EURY|nr:CoB--CoM heterodisulfide reductase subunit C [Methanobrevibacter curvatus]KZX11071.1 succinate dehydrogenase/fumarate reductase iron-sulfur subunit [Methanobrevibacter curvatus]